MTKINTTVLKKDIEVKDNLPLTGDEIVSFEFSEFDTDHIVNDPFKNEISSYYTTIPKDKLKELLETGETSYFLVEVTHVKHTLNNAND